MNPKQGPSGPVEKSPGKSTGSWEEARFRRAMESSTLTHVVAGANLPPLPAPSLEGLTAHVPATPELTEELLLLRFTEQIADRAPRIPRPPGASVEMDDWVTIDLIAYCGGLLLPELTAQQATFFLTPDASLPGFAAVLLQAGAAVGAHVTLNLTLPADYPLEPLRGAPVACAVTVHAAATVELPPGEGWSPEFLEALGFPREKGDALIEFELEVEALQEQQRQRAILEQIWDQLISRAPAQIPESTLELALDMLWKEGQGRFLSAAGTDPQDVDHAGRMWVGNLELREGTRRRLHISLIVAAVARQERFTDVDPNALEDFVRSLAGATDLDAEGLLSEMRSDPTAARRIAEQYVWLRTVNFIFSRAETVED